MTFLLTPTNGINTSKVSLHSLSGAGTNNTISKDIQKSLGVFAYLFFITEILEQGTNAGKLQVSTLEVSTCFYS